MKTKHISNLISTCRIPLSLLLCYLLVYRPTIYVLWIIFFAIELSDFLDGFIARKMHLVTEIGKLIDPASDVLSRISILFIGAYIGTLPLFAVLLLFYREVSMTFFRAIMANRKTIVAANWLGKLKTVAYSITIALVLFDLSVGIGNIPAVSAWVAVVLSVVSFLYYLFPGMIRTKAHD